MPLRRRAAKADRHTFELVDDGLADDVDVDPVLDLTAPPDARRDEPQPGRRPDNRRPGATDIPVEALDIHDRDTHDLGDGARTARRDGGPGRAAARRRRRRVVAASVVGLAVVLGGMATVDAAQSSADLARLRESPGGVAPMISAPQEVWSVDGVVPGALELVAGAVVTVEGHDVVAHDSRRARSAGARTSGRPCRAAWCSGTRTGSGPRRATSSCAWSAPRTSSRRRPTCPR
ncbi:hypothetical protein [Cellulosimicrobium sp. CUA-896]|uniref:hypothetical protein n=1 Tax=Cellulosimicrobium sp. CUA-896 TaxID=1517881 RepID=UPI00210171BD|nr:hypothetical protein [Cellulosimicrobium sp. CUA-896]